MVSSQLDHAGSLTGLVHGFLHTGQTAPLVVLVAAPLAAHGVEAAVAAELPFLLLLATGAFLLARRWLKSWAAALVALVATANQAVLGWALMVHFSVAACAFCLIALAAYLWSDGFRSWSWSALTGVAAGLLLLSRSLAPLYAAALGAVIAIDLIRRRRWRVGRAVLALLTAGLVAAPWWLVSGGTALHYLRSAGYESSTGFTTTGAHLSLHAVVNRLRWTLGDLGTVQAIGLLAAPLVAGDRIRRMPGAPVVLGWLALTFLGLATSSNVGTGFGLPLVAVGITVTGALVLVGRSAPAPKGSDTPEDPASVYRWSPGASYEPVDIRRFAREMISIAAAGVIALAVLVFLLHAISLNAVPDLEWEYVLVAAVGAGLAMRARILAPVLLIALVGAGLATFVSGGRSETWLGPPYKRMALQATRGDPVPNIYKVHQEVANAISGHRTLLVRDDDLMNSNGLVYESTRAHLRQDLVSAPYGDSSAAIEEMKNFEYVISGTSPAPYHRYASIVAQAAAKAGWRTKRSWKLSCGNTIDLLERPSGSKPKPARPESRYERLVLARRPLAFWRLNDDDCDAADSSGNFNTATGSGKPGFRAPPLVADGAPAIHFDGEDDQITFLDSPTLRPSKRISVEAWLRPDDIPSSPSAAWQLVSKWNTAVLWLQGGKSGRFVFALYDAKRSSYGPYAMGRLKVHPRRTYHVVGTFDGTFIRVYVNGSLVAKRLHPSPLNQATYGGVIAAKGWGDLPSPHFRGELADVAIYGKALTAREVAAHYRAGVLPTASSP